MKHVIRMFLLLLTILLTCSLCIACSGDRDPAQTTAEGQTKAEAPSEETADTAKNEETTTSDSAENTTAEETGTEEETTDPFAYRNGEDITVVRRENKEIPVGRLTILGQDISAFKIISTEEDRGAASTLRDYIAKATGVTPECIREHSGESYPYEIVVGVCNTRSPQSVVDRRAKLGDEGYMIYAEENRLYISGATMRGTYYAVISFLEDYIGCRFFTEDCEVVLPAASLEIPAGTDEFFVPKLFYRAEYADFCNNNRYAPKHKLNAYLSGNLDGYGGGVSYAAGAFVHTFRQLAEMKEYKVGDQPCLTDPAVYETVLKNVRAWLDSNRNATIISVSPNDSYTNQAGCQCANCKALDDQYGSPMGSLLTFVNRIARDIREDYPQVYVETLAYHYTQTPPVGLVAEDNVLIRLCPSACCMVHGIAGCEQGDTFRADLTAWSKICKNLSIWHYSVNFGNYLLPLPNLFSIYDDVQLYLQNGVVSIFDEAAYNSRTGEFEELRSYLFSKLMWNPDMTREEYERHMNEFLQYYYGDGWEYIRRYIDATYTEIAGVAHFNHAANAETVYPVKKSDDSFAFLSAMYGLFEKAEAAATTPEEATRIRKSSVQALYLWLYRMDRSAPEDMKEKLAALIKEAHIAMSSEGRVVPAKLPVRKPVRLW